MTKTNEVMAALYLHMDVDKEIVKEWVANDDKLKVISYDFEIHRVEMKNHHNMNVTIEEFVKIIIENEKQDRVAAKALGL